MIKTGIKILSIVLFGSLFLDACSQKSNKRTRGSSGELESDDSVAGEEGPNGPVLSEEELVNFQAKDGIKSGTQLYNTYLTVTGVAGTATFPDGVDQDGAPVTKAIQDLYSADLSTALPLGNRIQNFNAGNQSAIIKLAVAVCHVALEDPTLRAALIPGVDFTQTPAAFSDDSKAKVASALLDKFWGAVDFGMNRTMAVDDLKALQTDLIKGLTADMSGTAQGTLNVTKGACAAVAASFPTILL
ncbi:MAG: hypothetical protein AB7T49_05735 [Oligoflexales bacterium]